MKVVFRAYEPRDFESCLAIYHKNEPGRFPAGHVTKFIEYLKKESRSLIVAEFGSKVVGYGGITLLSPNIAVLCYGIVAPEFQGQRIGSALTLLRIAQLSTNPDGVFFLIFAVDASMPIYERFGFVEKARWKSEDGKDHPLGLLHVEPSALDRVKSTLERRGLNIQGNLLLQESEKTSAEIQGTPGSSYRILLRSRVDKSHSVNQTDATLAADQNVSTGLIGGPEKRPIVIVDYDPQWPAKYQEHASRILQAVGGSDLQIEHIGSTSVPGLGAKPVIDILLVVKDAANEADYLSSLEATGYVLRVREPDFDEHRMFRNPERNVHIHVFGEDSKEIARYLVFRDHLRRNENDRKRYEALKRELATRDWPHMDAYAAAKGEFIESIIARAQRPEAPANEGGPSGAAM
jgi:GrpB-like predicted nucleotidyltransferase (UPF0157 family)/predicted N-acetyltransferase YhbS